MKTIRVVAAVIRDKDKIFATARGYGEFKGELVLKEAEVARWLSKDELYSVQWLPADLGLVGKREKNI